MMYNCDKLSKDLEGLQTIENVEKKMNIKRQTAIKYIHLLRKKGLVETKTGSNKKRIYKITRLPRINADKFGFYDILNKNSPIKIWEPYEYKIIGRKVTIEETIAWAAEQKDLRIHIAVLALFKKVKNWSVLYKYAKEYNVRRKVGALYDVARTILKTKRMDKRIKNKLIEAKNEKKSFIPLMKSKDFKDIEKRWKVFIPFNKADLERYKE